MSPDNTSRRSRAGSPRLVFPLDLSYVKARQTLGFQAMALLCSYTLYGYLQEKIMTTTYDGVKFRSSVLLVAFNRIAGILVAVYMQQHYFGRSLKPRHPLYAYTSVSLFNFLSTLCQYEALKYVNFTAQTLGKCSKMVPVLLLGVVVYGKQYRKENYMAVGLVTLGTALYMLTTRIASTAEERLSTGRGLSLLVGYLLFDGLASTTEERLFKGGKKQDTQIKGHDLVTAPQDKSEMVYDQMLWINICSLGVSSLVLAFNKKQAVTTFIHLATGPSGTRLMVDILLLSLSASVGLIFLLTIIATFGALTSSTLMTSRQFLSIVLNGIAFGNAGNVGISGWTGIGYVASGVCMEVMNKRRAQEDRKEEESLSPSKRPRRGPSGLSSRTTLIHLSLPVVGGLIVRLLAFCLIPQSATTHPSLAAELFPVHSSFTYGNSTYTNRDLNRIRDDLVCPLPPKRQYYSSPIPKTALASFPRSGNTFSRELIEHSTGYYTVHVGCKKFPDPEYHKEACAEPDNRFLVKTHAPEWETYKDENNTWLETLDSFDRAVHVVRNPLDAIWSFWHLIRNVHDHTWRAEGVDQLDLHHIAQLDHMTNSWNQHTDHWLNFDKPCEMVRYEDLRGPDQTQHLARILSLLLPNAELPPIERLLCADDDRAVAYQSRKADPFYAWDHFTDDVRTHILNVVKPNWCKLGFEDLLRKQRGHKGVDCD